MLSPAPDTELLIVPTAHLTAELPDSVVAPARNRLARWRPDLVAIEALPGHLVVEYELRGGTFGGFEVGGALDAWRGAALLGATPGEVWSARRAAMAHGTPLDERVLAWLRAREPINALLLPYADARLASPIMDFLDELSSRPRETVSIGASIARRLGHDHVAHVDDHTGVENIDPLPEGFEAELTAFREQVSGLLEAATSPRRIADNLWAQWRFHSSTDVRRDLERLESAERLAAGSDTPRLRRVMLANWRARNLAMAARLRSATAAVPGGRVLFVVGSAHEVPLRTALGSDQHDLRLVELAELEE
ncbi:DUF5694 domain-containing protein [Brachybacterium sp. FME24]|uniref:DUF5694 domain-containing protein n=1 Tax=Brachybacterium sp. FME24 TaxID=2742605 RepID=UPI0018675BEB|nr:DUF5694 domain-containing protein [Brachybacterium sp. FME24]